MKCNTYVKWELRGKKRPKLKPVKYITQYHILYCGDKPEKDMVLCDGNIKVDVELHIDGGCGCCGSPEINIYYKCDKCSCDIFTLWLPTDEIQLSELVTESLINYNDKPLLEKRVKERQALDKTSKETREWDNNRLKNSMEKRK